MLNLKLLPESVLDDLMERYEGRKNPEQIIRELSARDAFDEYLSYNGIFGYTDQLIEAFMGFQTASTEQNLVAVVMVGAKPLDNNKPVSEVHLFSGEALDDQATDLYMSLCERNFTSFIDRASEMLDNSSHTEGETTVALVPVKSFAMLD